MYEQYTESARRAIFFAIWYSRLRKSRDIDSVDLLRGLMHDGDSRVNTVFGLREYFPLHCGCPSKSAKAEEVPKPEPVLTNEVKRILARSVWEADAVGDYWIDTEHLLLGILREQGCMAEQFISRTGLTLKIARRMLLEKRELRPVYGPVPGLWRIQTPWSYVVTKWRMRR